MKKAILSILFLTTNAFAGNVEVINLGAVNHKGGTDNSYTVNLNYFELHVIKKSFGEAYTALQEKCFELGTESMAIQVVDTELEPDSEGRFVKALCTERY